MSDFSQCNNRFWKLIDHLRHLDNSTSLIITVYEESTGDIISIKPKTTTVDEIYREKEAEPPYPTHELPREVDKYHIVSPSTYEQLKNDGHSLDDIVVVTRKDLGRNNVDIYSLVWGRDPNMQIRLYGDYETP